MFWRPFDENDLVGMVADRDERGIDGGWGGGAKAEEFELSMAGEKGTDESVETSRHLARCEAEEERADAAARVSGGPLDDDGGAGHGDRRLEGATRKDVVVSGDRQARLKLTFDVTPGRPKAYAMPLECVIADGDLIERRDFCLCRRSSQQSGCQCEADEMAHAVLGGV